MEYQKKLNLICNFLFYLLPISFIFSTFFSNLIIISISIFAISHLIKETDYKFLYNFYSILFISFCIYISLNSILFKNVDLKSIKSSFFFIRYLFLVIGIYYLYKFNNQIFNNFFNVYLFLLIFIFDSNYQYLNNGINTIGVKVTFKSKNLIIF